MALSHLSPVQMVQTGAEPGTQADAPQRCLPASSRYLDGRGSREDSLQERSVCQLPGGSAEKNQQRLLMDMKSLDYR